MTSKISRRNFLRASAALGASLTVGLTPLLALSYSQEET